MSIPGPGTDGPGQLVAIGSEGFAVAFGTPQDGTFGAAGAGGDVLFVPLERLTPVRTFLLPNPQGATGSIRYFPVPVQGTTVDRTSGLCTSRSRARFPELATRSCRSPQRMGGLAIRFGQAANRTSAQFPRMDDFFMCRWRAAACRFFSWSGY